MSNMLRREFLKYSSAALVAWMSQLGQFAEGKNKEINWSYGLKPLYCLAYIDPQNKKHAGQEGFISKYPIAIIPQDTRERYVRFRQRLRNLNPDQKLLGYMMTIDENGLRGPAHKLMQSVHDSWLTLPGGLVPTKNIPSGAIKKRRIYDPRKLRFRKRFVEACQLLVDKYHFDGIFFDNCTIYGRFASIPGLGAELLAGLQEVIFDVRRALPSTLLIANTRYSFKGLNGEMNEGRGGELPREAGPILGHVEPYINMYHYYIKNTDRSSLLLAENNFRIALKNKSFFGVGIDAQTIRWYEFFDRILGEYKIV